MGLVGGRGFKMAYKRIRDKTWVFNVLDRIGGIVETYFIIRAVQMKIIGRHCFVLSFLSSNFFFQKKIA